MKRLKVFIQKLKPKANNSRKSLVNSLINLLSGITIFRQVQVGFFLLVFISLLTGQLVWQNTNQISDKIDRLQQKVVPAVKLNSSIARDSFLNQINVYRVYSNLMNLDDLEINPLNNYIDNLREYVANERILIKLDEVSKLNNDFKDNLVKLAGLQENSIRKKVQLKKLDKLILNINLANWDLNQKSWEQLEQDIQQIINYNYSIKRRLIIIVILSLLIGSILGVIISCGVAKLTSIIKKRTKEAANKVRTVTKTSQRMEVIADDVDQEITQAFTVIKDLISGNVEVATAVDEVSISLQEVQEGVKQLSQQAKLISNAGKDTYQSIENTSQKIELGTKIIHKTADTMQELRRSADKIGKISDKIMHITDQTNLLALNAAIEAARAGEHGRGFAVVAEEIKELATESLEATKEVKGITKEIEGVIETAVVVMSKSKDKSQESIIDIFDEINDLSKQVKKKMEAVVSSSKTQVISSEQLNSVVEEISASSQEVAAQTEETLDSAERIKGLMTEVTHSISNLYFKIKEGSEVSQEQLAAINQVVEANQRLKK
ncbi:methyl-accepting chemotaxis protein [Orenia metallireducens]|uniref:Methyl-accepting chemotaxis protein n=1 Tax=Orenia metallireducens TaxID=1413210 RepID=A0A285FWR6_9FIRM|nr:methyl-accepting chemotaxis protein [Orenia metallireducens]SNY15719.1 methyl-accepting chemotaxis protein [Orenia metallireducens]